MPQKKAERDEAMERDEHRCQFFHQTPYPASDFSHFIHQGMGGRVASADVNQASGGAASCRECHRKLAIGKYVWEQYVPPDLEAVRREAEQQFANGNMTGIKAPEERTLVAWSRGWKKYGGKIVIRKASGGYVEPGELWIHRRWLWEEAKQRMQLLRSFARTERWAAWRTGEFLEWFKRNNIAAALENEALADYIDVGAEVGYSSAETKRRVKAQEWAEGQKSVGLIRLLPPDTALRLKDVPEDSLEEVAGWFRDLPPAEAWDQYNERYGNSPGAQHFRIFLGKYRDIVAKSVDELGVLPNEAVVVKGGTVLRGVRHERAS